MQSLDQLKANTHLRSIESSRAQKDSSNTKVKDYKKSVIPSK